MVAEMKCPECLTSGYYFRRADNRFVCKKCGATWPKPPEKVKA